MPFFTYILYSKKVDRYYIGSTANLEDRLARHNQGRSKATKPGAPYWKLMYAEEFQSRKEAVNRELFLKKMKSREFIEKLLSGA
ncbi:MAG: GIY-YIG nuclease family protein [Lewinellaceae bacterium]|nr:GIY-YIG nuclease family protein [Lewinellaceae bacterium]